MTELFNPAAPVIIDPPAEVRPDTTRAEQVIQRVITLDRTIGANQFEIGDLFAEIVDGDYFFADQCQTLKEFINKNGFELSKREIEYRIKNSRYSKLLGIPRAKELAAGISKIKTIYKLDPSSEYIDADASDGEPRPMRNVMIELVDVAAIKSLKDITTIVKALMPPSDDEEYVDMKLRFTVTDHKRLMELIEVFRRIHGNTVDSDEDVVEVSAERAIHLVFEEWAQDPNNNVNEDGDPEPISQFQDEAAIEDEDGVEIEVGF